MESFFLTNPTILVMTTITTQSRKVICGFPGIGKKYLSELFPSTIVNLEVDSFAWLAPRIRNHKFPQNYLEAIKASTGLVLVSTHKDVRDGLARSGISFSVCFPQLDSKHSYLERYRKRGSSEEFVRLMDIMWCDWHQQVREESRCSQSIVLKPKQYLSDMLEVL